MACAGNEYEFRDSVADLYLVDGAGRWHHGVYEEGQGEMLKSCEQECTATRICETQSKEDRRRFVEVGGMHSSSLSG